MRFYQLGSWGYPVCHFFAPYSDTTIDDDNGGVTSYVSINIRTVDYIYVFVISGIDFNFFFLVG